MNKYTLRFNQNELEMKYQNTRLDMRKQILFGVSSGFILMNLASIIFKILYSQEQYIIIDFLILAFAILSFILGICQNNYIREALTVLNLLQCSIQINLNEEDSSQQMFIFGANIMATQIILFFGSDFCYSAPQITLIAIIRIIILNFHGQIDWFSISLTFIISFWLCVVQYQFDIMLRKQFCLIQKNHDWDSLLPKIIENAFFYFEYKDSTFQCKFIQNESQIIGFDYNYCQGCNLRKFLREFKLNEKTLEQFITEKINNYDEQIQGKEIILKNKKGLEVVINFNQIKELTSSFIIIFKMMKNNFTINSQKTIIKKFLIQYSRQLVKLIEKKYSYCEILRLNYQYISILYFKPKFVCLFYPLKIIENIQSISGVFEIQSSKTPIEVFGYKNSFTIFWLQVALILSYLRTYSHREIVPQILIRKNQDTVIFKLTLENEGKFIQSFLKNKIIQLLKDRIFYYISYEQLILKMYSDMDISFAELDN